MGLRYGGKIVSDYSAMRGPCPVGFHVPSRDEWDNINNIGLTLNAWTSSDTNILGYLKLPKCGYRSGTSSTGAKSSVGTAYFQTCTQSTSSNNRYINIYSSYNVSSGGKSSAYPIRPFKDTPVIPDNSWTVEYQGTGTAGIYSNATLGLISISSDGTNWTTISDKNLGATTAWNTGDTATADNCGNYFQRGNNYGFAFSGSINVSSTKADATNYGPGNYYYSDTFITSNGDWSSVTNANLRGGTTGVQQRPALITKRYYGGKMIYDYSAMRGPCDSGFHIPMNSERNKIKSDLDSFGWTSGTQQSTASVSYLKMPLSGYRNYSSSNLLAQGTEGRYWACERYDSNNGLAVRVKSDAFSVSYYNISNGYSIRPFKDTPVIPDSSWTVEHQGTGTAGIYSNATLGLISISSDGTNWTTMADKNLGATQQYSILDSLSETNCGKYYQRGNIYGFAWTGTVQNTNTQVDASNYGPGNYFSSDIFINSSWEIGNNANLRGGVTGVQQRPAEVIKVYYGNRQIRPVVPVPRAEYTDWDGDVVDYVTQAFLDAGYELKGAIEIMFGGDFEQSIETDTGIDLSDWEFSPIMPFYPVTTSWYGLQISNGGDMIDKHLVPEAPGYTQSICIIRDNDNLDDVEYIVGTYDSSDDGFDYQLSSLASNFSGKDTVCMFIFSM